jgi:phosphopantetheine adenylyltransferase
MKEELGRFYTGHKDLLAEVQQTAETNYGQERLRSIVTDFCANRIGKGRQNETFGQHHAELGIWLKRQKEFDAKNQLTQPAGPTPQPQLRSAAPVNYSQSSPMRADKTE